MLQNKHGIRLSVLLLLLFFFLRRLFADELCSPFLVFLFFLPFSHDVRFSLVTQLFFDELKAREPDPVLSSMLMTSLKFLDIKVYPVADLETSFAFLKVSHPSP